MSLFLITDNHWIYSFMQLLLFVPVVLGTLDNASNNRQTPLPSESLNSQGGETVSEAFKYTTDCISRDKGCGERQEGKGVREWG